MNDELEVPLSLKPAARELQAVLEKLKSAPDAGITHATATQASVIARYQPVFSPDNNASITEEEFKSILLFENNQNWWGQYRQGETTVVVKITDILGEEVLVVEKKEGTYLHNG